MEKLNLTQQKYTFINQKKCTNTTQNEHKKLKPGLATSYDTEQQQQQQPFYGPWGKECWTLCAKQLHMYLLLKDR